MWQRQSAINERIPPKILARTGQFLQWCTVYLHYKFIYLYIVELGTCYVAIGLPMILLVDPLSSYISNYAIWAPCTNHSTNEVFNPSKILHKMFINKGILLLTKIWEKKPIKWRNHICTFNFKNDVLRKYTWKIFCASRRGLPGIHILSTITLYMWP